MRIVDDGQRNPCIVVEPEDIHAWMRKIADDNGFSDRSMCALQIQVEHEFGAGLKLHNETPSLVLMVSNIPNSRPA